MLASCVVFALISIPLIFGIVPPNGVYGFRTSFTLSSHAVWYPANAFMGWALLASSAVSAYLLVMLPADATLWRLRLAFFGPVLGAVAASFAYLAWLGPR